MTDTKKPPAAKKAGKILFGQASDLIKPEKKAAAKDQRTLVVEMADVIFTRYIGGESMRVIAATLPFKIAAWQLRDTLSLDLATRDRFQMAMTYRAHGLVEDAVDIARDASLIGDAAGMRVATDTFLKVAAKLAPQEYGERSKLELTGKDGGAIEVKADMTLSPSEAYERLIGGKG